MNAVGTGAPLAERARAAIPGGVNSGQRSVPGITDLVVARAEGARFFDTEGRAYTDYHAAFGPQLLGHNDPDVSAAVAAVIREVDLCGVGVTPGEIELAERLIELVPSFEQVLLTSTGSEATFHALRLSRAVTGRRLVVKFQGCYHGWHDAVSLNVISAEDALNRPDPISAGILPEVLESTVVLPFNDAEAVRRLFADHGDQIAGVIVEPVPHNIGCVLPTDEFLITLREQTTQHGAILIFDEVITGFRHALGGWQEISGITPDLTTLGKAFANGFPLGAIGGRADLMQQFSSRPGGSAFFAGTYNGAPVVVAAALATLTKLTEQPVHEHTFRLGELARAGLREVFAELDLPAVVTGYGSIFVSYFMPGPAPRTYSDLLANRADLFVGYRRKLIERGIFELPLNLKRSHISYAHTESDIEQLIDGTRDAVRAALSETTELGAGASTMGGLVRES
ncbi:aspartate aminotransferase family protein [Microlunatus parietis]|uniref:glutamate-1-semialdehyde 2,1-aminomutase n=1 Tax=Microlunatus parietis TaxID=682979 RepID=A0A7Y9LC58_9ACTN|nr:aspartate aminotransferase family protein [Microlunatus parietis]NYE70531.1 glutamate-1-semialdehyde 2,1-aminomutase [Microlunatus parietis]